MQIPTADALLQAKQQRAALQEELTPLLETIGKEGFDEAKPQILAKREAFTAAEIKVRHYQEISDREAQDAAMQAQRSINILHPENLDKNAKSQFRVSLAMHDLALGKRLEGRNAEINQEGIAEAKKAEVQSDFQGIFVPRSFATGSKGFLGMQTEAKRDMVVGTASAGGNLVETVLGELIPFLDPSLRLKELGATIIEGAVGLLDFPRKTARTTAGAVAEQGTATESNPTVGKLSLSAKRQSTFVEASLQLLIQGQNYTVENMIREDLMWGIWVLQERLAINGSGSAPEPRGILNTVGIGNVIGGTNGLAPTWDHLVDLETKVVEQNVILEKLAYLTTPGIAGKAKKTLRFSAAGSDTLWTGPNNGSGTLNDHRGLTSTLVPSTLTKGSSTDCNAIIFGNWRELIMAFWSGIQIIADPYSRAKDGTVVYTVNSFFDLGLRHVESFSAMLDARTV